MSALSRLTLLAALACCASAAHAVGLGPIELRSYLNEPLRADVALRDVEPERLDSISVRVASESAYEELGLARNDYLRTVDASLLLVDGQPVVRLRGNRPLQEPLLELLLVVREGRQLVQRSYTLFIDPPQFAQQRPPATPEPAQPQAAATPAPAADSAPASPPVDETPTESAATSAPEPEAPSTTASDVQPAAAQPTAQSTAQPAVEAPAEQAPSEPAPAEQRQPEAPATAEAPPAAAEPDTAAVVAQPAVPAAQRQAQQPEEAPRFFTTESERQLDPELLAEIGQGSGAARDTAPATPRPAASRSSQDGFYPVRRGETLWRVAANTRPQGQNITMQQMMLAIVQSNPNAFENGDASELLAGARLRIPDAARITSVSPAEAERQMRALLEGERTTQQAAASEPAPATQAAAGAPEEAAPAESAAEAADEGDAARELAALAEADTAPGQDGTSTPEAPSQSAAPADAGNEGAATPGAEMAQAPEASDEAPPAAEATDGDAAEGDAAADAAPSAMEQADAGAAGTTGSAGEAMEGEDAAQAEAAGADGESASAAGDDSAPSETSPPAADTDKDAGSGESTAAASGTGALLGLPWYLLLVIGGVVLLGIAGIIEMRRRAAQRAAYSAAEEEPRFANLTGASAGAATGAAVADDADQDEDSDALTQANEAEPAPATQAGELGESASDDPLADADFRIAYGMYDDAAERLTDAISRDPENATLRLKLAEVYCAADDKERFLDAADTAARTGLSEAEEAELADMAARIAPDSRFATAIGASMTAGTVFAESHAASASDDDVVEESSGETAADDDFASLLESSPDSTEPAPTAADLNEEDRSGGPPLGATPADGGKSAEAEDDLAFGDDFAAELADPSEAGRTGEDVTAPGAEPGADDNSLDFDLDNLEFGDETPAPASTPAETSGAAADDDHALDFDLEGLELPETPSASPEPAPVADDNSLDFDWETSEPDASVAETEPTAVDGGEKDGQPPASDLPTQGIGSTDSADPARPEEPATSDPFGAAELDAGDFDLDNFSLEDFDVDSSSEIADSTMPAGTSEDPPTLELPEPEPSAADSSGDDAFALDDFEIDAGDDTGAISGGDEGVAGQLDLARAYVDMGEGDMARPLLEEVLQSGDTAQRQEAQRLLDIAG